MELIIRHNYCENWRRLLEVLERFPKLQNITIQQDYWIGKEDMDNWKDQTIPKCLLTRLKTCLLKGYKCTKSELQFAKYIMQNSKVLNTMSIMTDSYIDKVTKNEMLMKLSSLTMASTSCKLFLD
ncbi:hypothetical protein P8452_59635 [Trifolium repens]|nr:hypothetical protein P8452_59635 [Trifolium repens]